VSAIRGASMQPILPIIDTKETQRPLNTEGNISDI